VKRVAIAGVVLAALVFAAVTLAEGAPRPRWDTRVLALVPPPGYPARAYVAPNGRIYEGTYDNPSGDSVRSRVFEYTGRGTLNRSWVVRGQDLSTDHGVQVATSDARARLLLLDRSPPRALLLNTRTGRLRRYATFADLAPCATGQTRPHCSPTGTDEPPVPNYAAWGRDGSLYVTDYLQAVIWRIPRGGGKANVWLADPRLDGGQFGTTGIVTTRDHSRLLFAQQSSAGGGDGNPSTGKLYAVRIRRHHRAGPIRRLWESGPADGPDGFAIARSGHVYIALAGSNQIAEVGGDGSELQRFPALPLTGDNGSAVPFDTPSSVMFLGKRLIVANQSFFTGEADHQAILDVEAGERGLEEFIPRTAGLALR
jgi:sugar lactone lactonase YvrE